MRFWMLSVGLVLVILAAVPILSLPIPVFLREMPGYAYLVGVLGLMLVLLSIGSHRVLPRKKKV